MMLPLQMIFCHVKLCVALMPGFHELVGLTQYSEGQILTDTIINTLYFVSFPKIVFCAMTGCIHHNKHVSWKRVIPLEKNRKSIFLDGCGRVLSSFGESFIFNMHMVAFVNSIIYPISYISYPWKQSQRELSDQYDGRLVYSAWQQIIL